MQTQDLIQLISKSGDLTQVVNAARVSFGRHVNELDDNDKKLIKYLWSHKHTSPFRHVYFTFRIKAPIFVLRQWMKHQVGCSWNEISARYVQLNNEFYLPALWRAKSKQIKQGSKGQIKDQSEASDLYKKAVDHAYNTYLDLLNAGVAREQARMILPVSIYSECYWTASLHAVMHFLSLRLDSHAQQEIRSYAEEIKQILTNEGFGLVMELIDAD
tara:strand:- start:2644 stop:3288 length:645 start_codon:yes stop_codon:yes gene_type:complete